MILQKKYGIILIEDCRSSLGAYYKGSRVGNLRADMTIFQQIHQTQNMQLVVQE